MNRAILHIGLNTASQTEVTEYLTRYASGWTLIPATGIWEGASEPSLVAWTYTQDAEPAIASIAQQVAERFNQSEVWYTFEPIAVHVAYGAVPVPVASMMGDLIPA